MNMEEVGSEKFRKMCEEVSFFTAAFGGAEAFQVLTEVLDLYVHGAVPSDEARTLLEGREAIFQASNSWLTCLMPFHSPAAWAAASLEALGDDTLADCAAACADDSDGCSYFSFRPPEDGNPQCYAEYPSNPTAENSYCGEGFDADGRRHHDLWLVGIEHDRD